MPPLAARETAPSPPSSPPRSDTNSARTSPARPPRARSGTTRFRCPCSNPAPFAAPCAPAARPCARNTQSAAAQSPAASAQRSSPRENARAVFCPPAARSTPPPARRSKTPPGTSLPRRAGTARQPWRPPTSPCPPQSAADIWTNPPSAQTVSGSRIWTRTPASTLASPFPPKPCGPRAAPPSSAQTRSRAAPGAPLSLFPSSTQWCESFPFAAPQKRRAQNLCAPHLFLKRHVSPDASPRNRNRLAPFRAARRMIRLRIRREAPALHVRAILFHRLQDRLSQVRILPRKLRRLAERQSQHVVQHQDLPVAIRPRADSNRGNPCTLRDLCRQLPRQRFQHHGKRPRSLHRSRIAQYLLRR